jgi:hypothetical protein
MKKLAILAIGLFALAFSACDKEKVDDEPFLAPTTLMKKSAVLEEFTGVRCGYCPDGHAIGQALLDNNKGKVVVINVHAGSYAAPQAGWPNFTTPYGSELVGQSGVSGFPAGTVNRHKFTGSQFNVQSNGLAMGRSGWTAAAAAIMQEDAPVNIGAKSTYDPATRKLTVKVDLYYTAAETVKNHINVAFLQSGLIGKQSGGGDTYVHKHMLREMITGQWGDLVPETMTAKGSKYTKTYTYTVPADYNGATIPPGGGAVDIDQCEVAVFVAREKVEILNGIVVKAK